LDAAQALERAVVEQNGHAVTRQLHVEFDPARAQIERLAQSRARVLWVMGKVATMGDESVRMHPERRA
jgi:hypothetical protein